MQSQLHIGILGVPLAMAFKPQAMSGKFPFLQSYFYKNIAQDETV